MLKFSSWNHRTHWTIPILKFRPFAATHPTHRNFGYSGSNNTKIEKLKLNFQNIPFFPSQVKMEPLTKVSEHSMLLKYDMAKIQDLIQSTQYQPATTQNYPTYACV